MEYAITESAMYYADILFIYDSLQLRCLICITDNTRTMFNRPEHINNGRHV